MLNGPIVRKIVENALIEDIGTGDITTDSIIPDSSIISGNLIMKEEGIVAGLQVAELVFLTINNKLKFKIFVEDGTNIEKDTIIANVEGQARSILTAERTALNFLQRMCGVATYTNRFVEKIKDYPVKILDTRKTTPGIRILERYAVRMGGGHNHRFGLFDAVLIKDNHIKVVGSIKESVHLAKKNMSHIVKIEVETQTLQQVIEAVDSGADIIMLDNITPEKMREAVEVVKGRCLLEASGNVTLENILEVAKTGINYISIGAITHSAPSIDISLEVV